METEKIIITELDGTYYAVQTNNTNNPIHPLIVLGNINKAEAWIENRRKEGASIILPTYKQELRDRVFKEMQEFKFSEGYKFFLLEGERCKVEIEGETFAVECVPDTLDKAGCRHCAFNGHGVCHRVGCEYKHYESI